MNIKNKPNFIVVDGIDGVGKSLLVEAIDRYLTNQTLITKVVHIVESTHLASEVKRYLKCSDAPQASATTLALLFCSAINDVIERVIEPAQLNGEVVIADRYTMSTRVYQADSRYVDTICDIIDSVLTPDITFVLDAPPAILKERMDVRGPDGDVTESNCDILINQRRKDYARLARSASRDTYMIDASGTPEDVAQRVFDILDTYYR